MRKELILKHARPAALIASLAIFVLRLPMLGATGLGDSEAYYWSWSRHLDLSYYDHPPAIAYAIRAGTILFGENAFGTRFFPSLMTSASLFIAYLAAETAAGTAAGLFALLAMICMPLFIVGGITAVPDAPMALFVSLALLFFTRAVKRSGSGGINLALAGLFIGLSFISKYSAILLIPGAVLVALFPSNRYMLRSPGLYIGILLCALCASPVAVWNMEHGWPSVTYHMVTRQGAAGLSWQNLGKLIGGQLGYFSPFVIAGLAWAVAVSLKERKSHPEDYMLSIAGLPAVLGMYAVILVTPNAEPHWPLAGYLFLFPVLGSVTARRVAAGPGSAALKKTVWVAAAFSAVVATLALTHILTPVFVRIMPASYKPKYDIVNELYGWDDVGKAVYASRARHAGRDPFLLGYHYTFCSQLMFSTGGKLELHCLTPRRSEYTYFPGNDTVAAGRDAIFVNDNRYDKKPLDLYMFDNCELEENIGIHRGGRKVRDFGIWYCTGYRGLK